MQSQHRHLYAAGNQSAAAAAYQNAAAAAAGYHGNVNIQPAPPAQYNVIMMPVNHPAAAAAQPGYPGGYPGGPGRDGAGAMMYGTAQPAGMMLAAQPMSQGQRSATVPQV